MQKPSRCASLLLSLACLCHSACNGDDSGDSPLAEEQAKWHLVASDLYGALFSVAGSAADDIWVVGADRGDELGPTLLHWDGAQWETHDTGASSGELLWAHVFDDGSARFAGSDGMILSWDGDALSAMETPAEKIVWGVWGVAPDDMWAVGGSTSGSDGFIWRFDGNAWEDVTLPDGAPAPGAWFKAWGVAADDVWFCGMDGALLHWDGSDFEEVDAGTNRSLLTVHGRADGSLVTAVGGQFSATLVASRDGGPWQDVTPDGDAPPLQTFGVHDRGSTSYAVGMQATVLRLEDDGGGGSTWLDVDHGLDVFGDLHGVFIDPAGGVWAAGGVVVSPPYRQGALIYRGDDAPATYEP